jgi:hypothetical protein
MLRGREAAKIMTFVRGITNPAALETKDSAAQCPVTLPTFGQRRQSLAMAIARIDSLSFPLSRREPGW